MLWSKLLPQKPEFFALFSKHAELCVHGARMLQELLEDPVAAAGRVLQIHELEHRADEMCQRTLEVLHGSFITPIDRTDIHLLTSRIDDIMDHIEASAQCIALYGIKESTPEGIEMSQNAVRATRGMRAVVDALSHGFDGERMRELTGAVKRVEKENDRVLRSATARLFSDQREPLLIIKWKQIYEDVEAAIDRCEDVANLVEGVVLENS